MITGVRWTVVDLCFTVFACVTVGTLAFVVVVAFVDASSSVLARVPPALVFMSGADVDGDCGDRMLVRLNVTEHDTV